MYVCRCFVLCVGIVAAFLMHGTSMEEEEARRLVT